MLGTAFAEAVIESSQFTDGSLAADMALDEDVAAAGVSPVTVHSDPTWAS